MSAIESLLMQPIGQAIGWALLQFVWQGGLIGIVTAAVLWALARSAADVRYVVATIGLSLMLTMPVVSAMQAWRVASHAATLQETLNPASDSRQQWRFIDRAPLARGERAASHLSLESSNSPLSPRNSREIAADARNPWMPLLLLGWLSGVAFLTLRLMSGWLWVRRMTTVGILPVPSAVLKMAERLRRSLHVRRTVRVLESTVLEVPTVIGWLKPVVLIPASALAALSPQQLEAIIAHELAHIRRHDYLVNLLQTLVETLLFYHPAVWWLSRRIRLERENCCDDLAVSLCGDAVTYARALADLEQLRGRGGRLALAVTGGSLLHRIRRLLGAPAHAGRGPGWLAGTVAVLLMAGLAAGAVGSPAPAQSAPAVPVPVPVVAPTPRLPAVAAVAPAIAVPAAASVPGVEAVPALAPSERAAPVAKEPAAAVPVIAALEAAATAPAATGQQAQREQQGNIVSSNNGHKLEVNYKGAIEFTDDDKDIKSLSPGGWLKIRESDTSGSKRVEFHADASGNLERRFWAGTSERSFEPEGRQWLAEALPRVIRQTGLGAERRVERILRTQGVSGVLAEIALIEGSWGKRIYYTHLLKSGTLDPQAIEQILDRAGRDIDSDFELASLLIESADRVLVTDGAGRAYFDAVRSIDSDFEMKRTFAAALKRGPVSPELLARLLEATLDIDSDFEAASLLGDVARQQSLDARSRPAFFKALGGVESDFEQGRVLKVLAARADLDADTLRSVLDSSVQVDSDFEAAALLQSVLKKHSIDGAARAPFFRALDGVESSFERGRVLQMLARRSDLSEETIVAILRSAQGMDGGFECSQVLLALAATHPIKGPARDVYIEIADRLGEFEQGQVLSALVKSERIRK